MKKVMAIVLSLLMALSLFACAKTDDTVSASPAETESAAPASTDTASAEPVEAVEPGYYDPNFDYAGNTKYKVVYMMSQTGVLYDMFDKAFSAWAEKCNVDYSSFSANSDNDLFLTTIETFATQGVNGFLFDADNTIYPRVTEIMTDLDLPWMSCMAEPLDDDGARSHPVVGFDNYDFGVQMATWVIDYAKKTWPEAKIEEVGMLSMDFSLSPQIHERTTGAMDVFLEAGYPEANFYVADGASVGAFSAEAGFNLTAPVYAANQNIKYWLITACLDDYADGAARAAEQAGIDANCVATTCGGSGLINQWDAGTESCWKSAVYAAQIFFGENIFFALYNFMDGTATPDSIFPEWIDHSTNQKYAYVNLPTFTITKDTYKEYMEWVDGYTGINLSPYDAEYTGTQFDGKGTPPASFAG